MKYLVVQIGPSGSVAVDEVDAPAVQNSTPTDEGIDESNAAWERHWREEE